MHCRKSHKPKLLLIIMALLALFAISISITFSWIEGGTTYTIQSDDENAPIKTDTLPDTLSYSGKITLNPATSSTIELINYDENTGKYQDLYFSPASSIDGENFLFPVKDSNGNVAFYRESNINDVGTKFINYDFDFTSTRKCFLAFDGKPTITAIKSGSAVADTSAFRIMLKCGDDQYVFTTSDTELVSEVVTDLSGATSKLKALPIGTYVNNTAKTARLFSFGKGDTGNIEVSVWLDDGSDCTAICGSDITLNLKLIAELIDLKANFTAVTYDRTGTRVSDGFTGGSIKYDSTTYNKSFTKEGTTFKASAITNAGYEFKGWYSDANCTKLVTSSTSLNDTPDDDCNYYAKFQETSKTTIYVEPRSGFSTYSIWAYQKFGSETHHYSGSTWPGESAVLDSATGYYKYEFTTPDTGEFRVIISNNGGSQYPASNEEGLSGNIGGTYLFTADNKLIEFNPGDMITLKVSSTTGGTATVNNTSSVVVRPGQSVTIKATTSTNYKFIGWYKDAGFTTPIGTTYETASQTITLSADDAGQTLNYYAKFEKIPTLTIKTSVTPAGGGTALANNSETATVQVGTKATLKATAASGYRFVGWYTNSACTATTGISSSTSATGATYTVSGNDGDTVTLYAKFVKTYTVSASAGTGGTVSVDKSTVDTGGSATFTATANSGYKFVGWYTAASGGTQKSTSNPYTLTNITANTTLYARFEQTGITIYFTNNYNWSGTIYCHYWGGSSESSWPGKAMTYVSTNSYGQKQYSITIPADTTGIIFDNGNGNDKYQTVNINSDIENGKGFYISGGSGKNYTVSSFDYN